MLGQEIGVLKLKYDMYINSFVDARTIFLLLLILLSLYAGCLCDSYFALHSADGPTNTGSHYGR